MFSVKEIFYSLQGEGLQAGRAAVFCRFSECNLRCAFCDTDFHGTDGFQGGVFPDVESLVTAIMAAFPPAVLTELHHAKQKPYVICTGGEPALQVTQALLDGLHAVGCEIGVESNGTLPLPQGFDWICISPKTLAPIVCEGDELKLVWPQEELHPTLFEHLNFKAFIIQPKSTPNTDHTAECVQWCLEHPHWRLSLQQHKILGIV